MESANGDEVAASRTIESSTVMQLDEPSISTPAEQLKTTAPLPLPSPVDGGETEASTEPADSNHTSNTHVNDEIDDTTAHTGAVLDLNDSTSTPAAKKGKVSSSAKKETKSKKTATKKISNLGTSTRPKIRPETRTPSPEPSAIVVEEPEEEEEVDTNLYCICQRRMDDVEGGMIMCDRCDLWHHYKCMGITEDNVELVDQFICPRCEEGTTDRTTYKEACGRYGCRRIAQLPFSRYCSQRCGVLQIASRMQSLKLTQSTIASFQSDPRVLRARSNEGFAEGAPNKAADNHWNATLQESILQRQSATMTSAESFRFFSTALAGPSVADEAADGRPSSTPTPVISSTQNLDREPATIRTCLAALDVQKARINTALDDLDLRINLLHLVLDRTPTLPLIGAVPADADVVEDIAESVDASAKPKSNKKKRAGDSSSTGGVRCGYDERLHWDNEKFGAWARSGSGSAILATEVPLDGVLDDAIEPMDTSDSALEQPKICALPKRKCRRHTDWSNLKESTFDIEKNGLNRESQKVTGERLRLEQHLQELEETIAVAAQMQVFDQQRKKQVEANRDEELAKQIALEGSRRAKAIKI